jgi:hypothetical protein
VRRGFLLVLVAAAAALLLSGCSIPQKPEVTFFAAGSTAMAKPYRYCNVRVTHCEHHDGHQVTLHAPPGTPVQVSVPDQVHSAPWTVVVQYRSASGAEQPPKRVATFVPDQRYAYTVAPPEPGAQIQTVEVQEAGAALAFGPDGNLIEAPDGTPQLTTRGVWSLRVVRAQK